MPSKYLPSVHGAQIGVLAGLANLLIYQHYMPPVADIRTAQPFNTDIEKSEREALFISIGITAVVATSVKSWETFMVAGAIIVAIDFAYKHANAVHPDTGKVQHPTGSSLDSGSMPMPDYTQSTAA